jgi:membrane-bound lytic murein transglycosylase D
VAAIAVVISVSTTGCGLMTRNSSELSAANEGLLRSSRRSPTQLTLQSTRVLPKPEFGVTPEVQAELDKFMTSDRATVMHILDENAHRYEATRKVFEGQGVPTELLSVAAVESGFNPKAASSAGARGMWQFMKSTARLYGLKVGMRKDERLDPNLSSVAAAKHLRDLFVSFQDWHLALAAYNAGSGAVNKIMVREGESDFWELARNGSLPRETRKFVPRVIALSLIFADPSRYGFENVRVIG